MVSVLNSSNLNLLSSSSFNGTYEDITKYGQINISINTDISYTLNVYFSTNGISDDFVETYNSSVPTETQFYNILCKERYFKLKLENNSITQSNKFHLQTIYKTNISEINTNITGSVSVSNFPATQPVTNSDITNIYNIVNSRGSGTLWSSSSTGVNGLSLVVNLSNKNIKNLTFMGNCNGPTVLTVQFSNDNSSWFDSQYSYTLSASGDVGFNLSCCPNYVRVKSSADVTASLYLNYC